MVEHIWTIEKWTSNPHIIQEGRPRSLRLQFEQGVDRELRNACLKFAKWLRSEYCFPVRVRVYFKSRARIRAMDGDSVCGTFMMPDDYRETPFARIATGDYRDLCEKYGEKQATFEILWCIAHELTHYFQWINGIKLTRIGEERQANRYGYYIVDEYIEATNTENTGDG